MQSNTVFDLSSPPGIPIVDEPRLFPVRRIFCVGRNYAAHAAEMGNEVDRSAPFYFTKSARALCLSGSSVPYPPGTGDCHHEMEFVVAIGAPAFRVSREDAMQAVYGFGCGIDLTRRDLQAAAKAKGRPWDLGKDFENAAIMGAITRAEQFGPIGDQRITLDLDGARVQDARLSDMIWTVPELLSDLSRYYHLRPGDLLFTGTPAGVGPVEAGSVLEGTVTGLSPLSVTVTAAP
ncbi:FAA hydrolase family protein [Roseovarius sp. TE539]|uniref:fumarylacetoacetate hydrolase family protein n=1 Tax=Roseovarius sp. TE539 TaxID=2249812 RepID=UPI000DDE7682|nr:fumarylacetoacetate hydrolase family protein [Roseovarius sp. TE539]RBI68328.1 FAA hydrolase family protein [Roseovarius sp. TE539]